MDGHIVFVIMMTAVVLIIFALWLHIEDLLDRTKMLSGWLSFLILIVGIYFWSQTEGCVQGRIIREHTERTDRVHYQLHKLGETDDDHPHPGDNK